MPILDYFRPKWRHSDWRTRLKAVEQTSVQRALARVAMDDLDSGIRNAAIVRLSEPAALLSVCERFHDSESELTRALTVLLGLKSGTRSFPEVPFRAFLLRWLDAQQFREGVTRDMAKLIAGEYGRDPEIMQAFLLSLFKRKGDGWRMLTEDALPISLGLDDAAKRNLRVVLGPPEEQKDASKYLGYGMGWNNDKVMIDDTRIHSALSCFTKDGQTASTAVLHLVSRYRGDYDYTVTVGSYDFEHEETMTHSLKPVREKAEDEVKRRGDPPFRILDLIAS